MIAFPKRRFIIGIIPVVLLLGRRERAREAVKQIPTLRFWRQRTIPDRPGPALRNFFLDFYCEQSYI
jgi:hypothetical protein